jgi:hypothetical protein
MPTFNAGLAFIAISSGAAAPRPDHRPGWETASGRDVKCPKAKSRRSGIPITLTELPRPFDLRKPVRVESASPKFFFAQIDGILRYLQQNSSYKEAHILFGKDSRSNQSIGLLRYGAPSVAAGDPMSMTLTPALPARADRTEWLRIVGEGRSDDTPVLTELSHAEPPPLATSTDPATMARSDHVSSAHRRSISARRD